MEQMCWDVSAIYLIILFLLQALFFVRSCYKVWILLQLISTFLDTLDEDEL